VFRALFVLLLSCTSFFKLLLFLNGHTKTLYVHTKGMETRKKRGFDVALKPSLSVNDVEVVVACVACRR
jgi:hypothetical protein